MDFKIAVIADLHYSEDANPLLPERRGDYADIFLLRAVHRINRFIKPDLVLLLGDLINDPLNEKALDYLRHLKSITDLLKMPVLAIPGNHDPAPTEFYTVFPETPEFFDINGYRVMTFLDKEEPGFNASRNPEDIRKMEANSKNFKGGIISAQHVPLFPPGTNGCPYNYTNAAEIISMMKKNNIFLSISGHYHTGFDIMNSDDMNFTAAPAFCETPFKFMEITIDGKKISSKYHSLKMPEEYSLTDYHVHTSMAYCNENITMGKAVELGKLFGLEKLVFSEHSGHLYFNNKNYGSDDFCNEGIRSRNLTPRIEDYFASYRKLNSEMTYLGIEIDYDFKGYPIIKPEHLESVQMAIGSIHYLPELRKPVPDMEKATDEFLFISEKILKSGVKILAHPFRVFIRSGQKTPECLFEKLSDMLKEYGVSPEINYHTNNPEADFFRLCLNKGLKLALGSDSHNLYEVGEFAPHLEFLNTCGITGNPKEILLRPEEAFYKKQ